MSPAAYREFCKPYQAAWVDAVRSHAGGPDHAPLLRRNSAPDPGLHRGRLRRPKSAPAAGARHGARVAEARVRVRAVIDRRSRHPGAAAVRLHSRGTRRRAGPDRHPRPGGRIHLRAVPPDPGRRSGAEHPCDVRRRARPRSVSTCRPADAIHREVGRDEDRHAQWTVVDRRGAVRARHARPGRRAGLPLRRPARGVPRGSPSPDAARATRGRRPAGAHGARAAQLRAPRTPQHPGGRRRATPGERRIPARGDRPCRGLGCPPADAERRTMGLRHVAGARPGSGRSPTSRKCATTRTSAGYTSPRKPSPTYGSW